MILTKLKLYALMALGIAAGIAVAIFYGYTKGKAHAAGKVLAAKQAAADAKATTQAHEVRENVDTTVEKLPEAPPQPVATADPDTAAGKLRDDGWTR